MLASVGGCGCLGCGCVVGGGVFPVWLRGAVASGGVSVGFDVGGRVFMLGGVSAPVSASGSCSFSGGVVVCVPCAVRVFGVGWCSLVLRRWARAAGVDVGAVSGLLGSAPVSGSVSGPVPVASSPSRSSVSAPVSGGSVSVSGSSRVGRVGVGFGARVRDWGARVGVGGGVVSGGGVVAGWWGRWRGRASGLASSVGVWGLALLGVVFFVVLVSVVVLVV